MWQSVCEEFTLIKFVLWDGKHWIWRCLHVDKFSCPVNLQKWSQVCLHNATGGAMYPSHTDLGLDSSKPADDQNMCKKKWCKQEYVISYAVIGTISSVWIFIHLEAPQRKAISYIKVKQDCSQFYFMLGQLNPHSQQCYTDNLIRVTFSFYLSSSAS